jgi:DNA mismatch repair ATPase MutS
MFETEVWFAANLLRKENGDAPGLVLYDELFHSTNPPDGIKTAERFLNKIWKKEGIMSIISTHLYHLVEAAPESVQKLTCMADISPTGEIIYKYNVQKGVCKISSVKSIWKRFQL